MLTPSCSPPVECPLDLLWKTRPRSGVGPLAWRNSLEMLSLRFQQGNLIESEEDTRLLTSSAAER
jgi:hypothetical protein